ncbi:uncharacterized transmembrane protein DDB_G0289901-like isoform X1 [Pollicipes pollicipes]|uniref:uncharacterized transmembrane protein DDB_G0289901-like isoform X1 n=1 Tax=Pollicipes pollicipes TaxID=41117 RepID=UPI001884DB83|nr:uncharacterized transmembrane protein DDB_G0289901-like isoform X1 [Pollicipes pollicipes]
MARSQWMLLASLCVAGAAVGSLLPGGSGAHDASHHGSGVHHAGNSHPSGGGGDTPPPSPLPQPPGGDPQLYFPPQPTDGAATGGDGLSALFPAPTGGGWTPLTTGTSGQQSGGDAWQATATSSEGGAGAGTASQSAGDAGSLPSSYIPPTAGGEGSPSQESFSTGGSSQFTSQPSGGGATSPSSSYVPPSSGGSGASQPTFTTGGSPSQFAPLLGVENNAGSSFPTQTTGNQFTPTSLKPLGLPAVNTDFQENTQQGQLTHQPSGEEANSLSSSYVPPNTNGGDALSQGSFSTGGSSQPDTGSISSPSSLYVPPSAAGSNSPFEGAFSPGGSPAPPTGAGDISSLSPSHVSSQAEGGDAFTQGIGSAGDSSSDFTFQSGGEDANSPSSLHIPGGEDANSPSSLYTPGGEDANSPSSLYTPPNAGNGGSAPAPQGTFSSGGLLPQSQSHFSGEDAGVSFFPTQQNVQPGQLALQPTGGGIAVSPSSYVPPSAGSVDVSSQGSSSTGGSSSEFTSESSGGDISSPSPSYVPPSSESAGHSLHRDHLQRASLQPSSLPNLAVET